MEVAQHVDFSEGRWWAYFSIKRTPKWAFLWDHSILFFCFFFSRKESFHLFSVRALATRYWKRPENLIIQHADLKKKKKNLLLPTPLFSVQWLTCTPAGGNIPESGAFTGQVLNNTSLSRRWETEVVIWLYRDGEGCEESKKSFTDFQLIPLISVKASRPPAFCGTNASNFWLFLSGSYK